MPNPPDCELCQEPTPNKDLQARYLPEFQGIYTICGACRSTKVHWDITAAGDGGDVTVC